MSTWPRISVIIPALNEEESLPLVLRDLAPFPLHEIIVVDNGSTDRTAERALACGARVITQKERGYGAACLAGMEAVDSPEIIVFIDGDYSDHPDEIASLVEPVTKGSHDMVIGSRVTGKHEPGAFLPQARWGNWLAVTLIHLFTGMRYTDLGPFRAIQASSLQELGMRDRNFGWTVEMQIRAVQKGLRICEVPVSYRKRIGTSKITGTIKGTVSAGYKILYTIFRYTGPFARSRENVYVAK